MILEVGGARIRVPDTKLDTGASFCIFTRGIGEALGLIVEDGIRQPISLANGQRMMTYGHVVTLESLALRLEVTAYFAEDPAFVRNVLGRNGWLQKIRIGLVDYDGGLYVSHYDDLG